MKIELTHVEFVEIIRALQADETPRKLSNAQKKIINDYTSVIAPDDETYFLEKNNRPKAACAL